MITHIRLQGGPFSLEDKCVLVQAALNLILSTDPTIFRRINTWLFGIHDEENKYTITEENSEILEILTESFKNIFSTIPSDSISAMLPIKVLQVFFTDHDYFISLMMK